ncbi:MAG: hypothetical protein M3044_12835 [Thermoproteota archaeon]|nr:hypothetical protein [Thermoproteota archaeon]
MRNKQAIEERNKEYHNALFRSSNVITTEEDSPAKIKEEVNALEKRLAKFEK